MLFKKWFKGSYFSAQKNLRDVFSQKIIPSCPTMMEIGPLLLLLVNVIHSFGYSALKRCVVLLGANEKAVQR